MAEQAASLRVLSSHSAAILPLHVMLDSERLSAEFHRKWRATCPDRGEIGLERTVDWLDLDRRIQALIARLRLLRAASHE